ncbi:MAG TPA: hypothetical protein V6D13_10350 [Halomicronema sp.]
MNVAWTRFLKSAYRREPLFSFMLTIGAVDAVMGSLDARGSLLAFGLTTMILGVAVRWWQIQRSQVEQPERVPELYLPPASSRPALPVLSPSRKQPRR